MTSILLKSLHAHPHSANVLPKGRLKKLIEHIRYSGRYPALIVRRVGEGGYQILDGHYRAVALRHLGLDEAHCDIWEVDDDEARMLLLTLNRLVGRDDPRMRGELLLKLDATPEIKALAKKLPEDARKIRKLIELTQPPPDLAAPLNADDLPYPVTFFLTATQRKKLLARLRSQGSDRAEALLMALSIEA